MNDKKKEVSADKPDKENFLVVGIGASAGGVEALQAFFVQVPADSDMAYVIILHLSPDYDSQLATILGRVAHIPVTQVREKVVVVPNHVYVVSPNHHFTIEDGELAVSPNMQVEDRRAPVDIFFRTLAEAYHSYAVGVVLSGTGANGSMGIKRIKERGGAAFVQNPREAQFNEMPRNAIATDLIDGILPVAEIPLRIIAYRDSLGVVHIAEKSKERPEDQQHALREIFTQLRLRTGHDFTNYKRATLLRRIERRINVHNLASLTAYATYLQQTPEEAQALLKDLLISVTNFFRDKKAFDYIETEVLPRILMNKEAGSALRIWIIGCATGEEAYSIAMLCAERTLNQIDAPKVQIFATDIDEAAIAVAREGSYTLNDAADVSPEQLRRFFTKEGDSYRIRREIREMVLFATHNILKDPPFSHLDMVTCRNMLIYLNHTAQERVMETVHFALEPGGYLFLGSSESTDGAGDLYANISREYHVYQSRAVATRPFPVPESVPYFNNTLKTEPYSPQQTENRTTTRFNYADLHLQLLELYAPPSMVVNEEYDIVHVSERAGKYLQVAGGEISKNLLKLIRPELRLELRTALYQAVQRRANVEASNLSIRIDDAIETINIHIRPVLREEDTARGFMLILFEPVTDVPDSEPRIYTANEPAAQHLEEELTLMKARLRNTIEQHELQAEELKASNEELQAMNEELRSAAEELETSKEELQSINEELTTVNQELKIKIEETTISNNNFQNLINSTDIATLFLDRSLRINMFTPAARELFNVIPADIGRPLSDITNKMDYTGLLEDAELVLERLQMIEKEVRTGNGSIYLLRVLPYRTEEDRINGVVVSFINITERKKAEEALRQKEAAYREQLEQEVTQRTAELKESKGLLLATMDASMDMIQVFEAVRDEKGDIVDFRYVLLNHEAERWMPDATGKSLLQIQPGVVEEGIYDAFKQVVDTGLSQQYEKHYVHEQFDGWFYQSVVKLGDGVATTTTDITERKKAELEVLKLKDEIAQIATDKYRSLFDSIDEGFSIIELIFDNDGKLVDFIYKETNSAVIKHVGMDLQGKRRSELNIDKKDFLLEKYEHLFKTGEPLHFEYSIESLGGQWFQVTATRIGGEGSKHLGVIFRNITDRKRQEEQQAYFLRLNDALRPIADPIEVQRVAMQILGEHLKVDRAIYADINLDQGYFEAMDNYTSKSVQKIIGRFPFAAFGSPGEKLKKGETLIIHDISADVHDDNAKEAFFSIDVHAVVAVPLIKNQKLVADLSIHHKKPRHWRDDEVALIQETAERTWAAVERAKAEEALRTSENRFRTLTDAVPQVIRTNEAGGKAVYFNQRWYEYSGLTYEQSAGPGWEAIVHPDDAPASEEKWKKALAAGEIFDAKYRLRRADGAYRWHIGRNVPLRNEDGEVTGWFGSATDIHDLAMVEASLRESEERNRAMVNQTSVGIVRADVNGRVIFMNEKAHSMFAFTNTAEKDNTIWELTFEEDLKEHQRLFKRLIKEELPFQFEKKLKRQNGTQFWASVSMAPIKDGSGATQSAVAVIVDVTGRKQAEEALRETMERFQYALRATKDVIWEIDYGKNHVWWSSMMQTLFGYSQYEVQHSIDWFKGLIHPADRERVTKSFTEAVEGKEELWLDEFRYQQANRAYVYVTCRSYIIRNKEGKAMRMIGAMQDITERREAEEAVRKSEERLRVTLESARDYVIITQNAEGIIEGWNSGAEQIFGYETAEAIGNSTAIIFTPEDRAAGAAMAEMETARRDGRAADERWHLRKDGVRIFLSGVLAPIRNNNAVTGFVKVARDMTAQKQAEEALLAAQNSLNIALEAAKMGVWDMDLLSGVVTRSVQHDRLLGYATLQEEWSPEKAKQHLVAEDKAKFDEAFGNMLSKEKFELEARVHHSNGTVCWVHYYGRVFKNDKGEPTHAAGVIFDITDRKSVDQKKDEFIGVASHELKTPVTSIKAYTEILYDQFMEAGDKNAAVYLEKLNGQVDRLTRLIRDLLDATRISEGRLALNVSEVDINQLLRETADELQNTAGKHTIELNLQDLPTIRGDKERLQQVIVNLIGNAIKYSPDANRVLIKTYQNNGNINIAVQDFGIGMSEETQSKLFGRFFRSSDPGIGTFPGLGLGLYISMQIIKQHKGTIGVQSEKDKGATFTIVLPEQE